MKAAKSILVREIRPAYLMSIIAALLMTTLSLAGLSLQTVFYPTESLRRAFVANDVANLAVGLPILVVCALLAWRGRLAGLLLWPGALLYVTYNYAAYALALFSSPAFLAYLALAGASLAAIIQLTGSMDAEALSRELGGVVPARFCGGMLAAFGILFLLMGIGKVWMAATGGPALTGPEAAVQVADFLFIPAWILGGVWLFLRKPFGYLMGAALLFQTTMLFVGLLVYFMLMPVLFGAAFPLTDFTVIAAMSLVCLIPLALFLRGLLAADRKDS